MISVRLIKKNSCRIWRTWEALTMRPAPCLLQLSQIWPASICLAAACGESRTAQLARLSPLKIFLFFFFKMRWDELFFWELLAAAFRVLLNSHVPCSPNYLQVSRQLDDLLVSCGVLGIFFCSIHHVNYTLYVQKNAPFATARAICNSKSHLQQQTPFGTANAIWNSKSHLQ